PPKSSADPSASATDFESRCTVTRSQPTCDWASRLTSGSGVAGESDRKPQARNNGATVVSNAPPVMPHIEADSSTTLARSSLTVCGPCPALAFSWDSSLEESQLLNTCSKRATSRNTDSAT